MVFKRFVANDVTQASRRCDDRSRVPRINMDSLSVFNTFSASRLLRKSCTFVSAGCVNAGPVCSACRRNAIERRFHRQLRESDMLRFGAQMRRAPQRSSRGIRVLDHHRMTQQQIQQTEWSRNGSMLEQCVEIRRLQQLIDVVEGEVGARGRLNQRQAQPGTRGIAQRQRRARRDAAKAGDERQRLDRLRPLHAVPRVVRRSAQELEQFLGVEESEDVPDGVARGQPVHGQHFREVDVGIRVIAHARRGAALDRSSSPADAAPTPPRRHPSRPVFHLRASRPTNRAP